MIPASVVECQLYDRKLDTAPTKRECSSPMHWTAINYLAILAAGIASMLVGFAWYSRALFGPAWAKCRGIDMSDPKQSRELRKGMGTVYGASFAATTKRRRAGCVGGPNPSRRRARRAQARSTGVAGIHYDGAAGPCSSSTLCDAGPGVPAQTWRSAPQLLGCRFAELCDTFSFA
jgi:hypothetical protein